MAPTKSAGAGVLAILVLCTLCLPSLLAAQDQYLVGDWNGDGKDDIAVRTGSRILMDTDGDGVPDNEQTFGNGDSETQYLVGDWDGDGRDNIAVRRGSQILMDTNFDSYHDIEQIFGNGPSETEYLVGDWDGDGRDNIAVRRGSQILMDTNFDSAHDIEQIFGNGPSETEYLVGDWDGDGRDNIAVRRGSQILMDTNYDGAHDIEQVFGNGPSEDQYLVGDWDGDGRDNIAVRRGNQILMDTNFDSYHDIALTFVSEGAATTQEGVVSGQAGELKTAPRDAAEPAPTSESQIIVGTIVQTPTADQPPADVQAPPGGGQIVVAPSQGIPVAPSVNPDAPAPVSFFAQGGQQMLLSDVVPLGNNVVGAAVSGNRQHQVLLRLFGMPYGTYPMLEAAARRYLTHGTGSATPDAVAAYLQSVYDNPDLRLGFASALLVEGVEAILADDRNEAQRIFYTAFSRYSGSIQYQATRTLYRSWKFYTGDSDPAIGPVVAYKQNTLGLLIDTGKNFGDFHPPESGLDVGPAGLLAVADLYGSAAAKDLEVPQLDAEVDVAALGELATLIGNAAGPTTYILLGKAFNNNFKRVVLNRAAAEAAAKGRLAAKRLDAFQKAAYDLERAENPGIKSFSEWLAEREAREAAELAAKKTAAEGAEELAENLSKRLSKEVSEEVIEQTTKEVAPEVTEKLGERLAAKASARIIQLLGETGATVLGGTLMAIPAIIDIVMAIVARAETDRFDAEITAAFRAGPNYDQDLKTMIAPAREYDAGVCYQWCKPGYSGLATLCYKDCPEGYRSDAATCVRDPHVIAKERYNRGQTAMICAPGQEESGGVCYTPCQSGYTGVANSCIQSSCPSGFRDDGLYCAKPAPYSREGFPWQIGDPPLPNYSGPTNRCEAKYGSGNCEQWGAVIYPKCKASYHADGCCTCSPDCPQGWDDIGVSCRKPTYDRGAGVPLSACPEGHEKIGALCYPTCKAGFTGDLDWCTNNTCPAGYTADALTCMRDADVFGRESYDRGVGFVTQDEVSCVSDDKRLENIAAIIGHMTKMMVADAADAGIAILPGDQIRPIPPQMMGISMYY